MTSHWRKFLLGVVICVALALVVLWGQRRASLQDDLLGQIAYESYNDQESAIYLMNPDRSHRSQVMLVKAFSSVCCAAWSSDQGIRPLYLLHIADSITTAMTTNLDVKGDPTWSPDSHWIAFSAAGTDGNVDIYKVNVETREIVRLTTDPADDKNPVWRPAS